MDKPTRIVANMSKEELVLLVQELASGTERGHDYCGIETRVDPPEDQRCKFCRLVHSLDFGDS